MGKMLEGEGGEVWLMELREGGSDDARFEEDEELDADIERDRARRTTNNSGLQCKKGGCRATAACSFALKTCSNSFRRCYTLILGRCRLSNPEAKEIVAVA